LVVGYLQELQAELFKTSELVAPMLHRDVINNIFVVLALFQVCVTHGYILPTVGMLYYVQQSKPVDQSCTP
jgi:hypothetical protein